VFIHVLGLPEWIGRTVAVLMVLGFPAALIFAWVYEITPEGLKPTVDVEPSRSIRKQTGQRLNRVIIVTLCVALAYFVLDKFWLSQHATAEHTAATAPSVAVATAPAATAISDKSVAVLPFLDMSEKKDQEYFSDGLSEELIDLLTKIPDLQVPARTSSFYFKGKQTTISDIAKTLRVAHVLEGSVRKSGNILRITAQLIRVDNGYHVWSETYDRKLDDIFKVQDDIAGAVVRALKVSLLKGEVPSATLTASTEAYELYLQAQSLRRQGSSDDSLKAYANLQQAVSLDPKFALAWASIAKLLTNDSIDWTRVFTPGASTAQGKIKVWGSAWAQARAAARAAAEQAIALGPDLGDSHAAMADVLAIESDWAAADRELERARELEPGNARITLAAADMAINLGRVDEGLQLAYRAAKQDPLGSALNVILTGQYASGALDEAQVSVRKIIELHPTASVMHFMCALILVARGDPQAALSELEREKLVQFRDVGRPIVLDALGRRSEADHAIAVAEHEWANGMAYNIAVIYASRNDSDRAFYWLERAYQQHDGGLSWLKIDPLLRNVRHDPRYKALLLKMGFPV
jgi:adenylate cyclase